jgi:RNA polymerase sigma factor (sigma-70 family)
MLKFEEIYPIIRSVASRYASTSYPADELVSVGWLGCREVENIDYIATVVKSRIIDFLRRQKHKNIDKRKIEKKVYCDRCFEEMENIEFINYKINSLALTSEDRQLLYERFYCDYTLEKMGEIHDLSKSQVYLKLKKIFELFKD